MAISQRLTRIIRANEKFFQSAVVLLLLALLLPACSNLAAEEPAAQSEQAAGAVDEDIRLYKRFAAPEDGERDHFVGAIDENLFIGVAVAPQGDQSRERPLAVYLCDGQTVSQWLSGEITGQEGTLVASDTSVDVTIDDGSVSGTVALGSGEPRPFTADLATGDAGLYRAEWNLADAGYLIDWIVLADGRQRGGMDGKGNDIPPPPVVLP